VEIADGFGGSLRRERSKCITGISEFSDDVFSFVSALPKAG